MYVRTTGLASLQLLPNRLKASRVVQSDDWTDSIARFGLEAIFQESDSVSSILFCSLSVVLERLTINL